MSLWYIILFILNYRKGFIMKRPTLHKLIFSILLFAISFLALFISHKSSAFADWLFFHHLPVFSFRPSDVFSESSHFLFLKLDCIFLSFFCFFPWSGCWSAPFTKCMPKKRPQPGSATVPHSCFSADVCLPFILFSAESTTDILHLQKNITWNPVSILWLNWPLYATNWLIS